MNLLDWKREGVALSQTNLPLAGDRRTFVERPKVIYKTHARNSALAVSLDSFSPTHCRGFFRHARYASI
jgi:hypothetical protein